MTDLHAALIRDICERPHEDAPRLIYADWLEEQDDQLGWARAEYIRAAIAVDVWARTPSSQPGGRAEDGGMAGAALARSQALWDLHCFKWHYINDFSEEPLPGFDWKRGFPYLCQTTLAGWLRDGPRIVSEQPVTEVRLRDMKPDRAVNEENGRILDAISTTAIAWARREAGLPELTNESVQNLARSS